MEFVEEIREFLIESNENLAALDREIVLLEQMPEDKGLISSAFRTFHTIKGTCGFFGFEQLGAITHVTENILSQARAGERVLTPELISLMLSAIDEIKSLLGRIETTGEEGEDNSESLRKVLEEAYKNIGAPETLLKSGQNNEAPSNIAAVPTANIPTDREDRRAAPRVSVQAMPESQEVEPVCRETAMQDLKEQSGDSEASAAGEITKDSQLADSTIRVDVGLLNRLMNLVGELVLARNQLLQETPAQHASLQQTSQRLNLITSELQEGVMKTRMQPIGVIWNKLPRVVRDLASKCGKRVEIAMEGAGTELDKTIIEAIKDPITHIVRNSCDHGIELPEVRQSNGKTLEGHVRLRAYHEGGVVNIEISDDGAGINPERVKAKAFEKGLIRAEDAAQMSSREAVQLIFMPGFSTAAQITSISGRGVGMDVVKTNIEKIGGNVEVINRVGNGTTIRIKIPLTLAIIPGLVVTLRRNASLLENRPRWNEEERFIIPQANLLELVRLEGPELQKRVAGVHGTPVFHHRGKLLPLLYLSRMLVPHAPVISQEEVNIVVLQAEHRQLGLVVDRICDTQEIVVKPLGRQLKGLNCYVGATIMGDGKPALILDVVGLARIGGLAAQARQVTQLNSAAKETNPPQTLLLFRAGKSDRLAVPLSMVDRLEEVSATQIERAGHHSVLYYRDEILPLVSLAPDTPHETATTGSVQIVVFSDGQRRVGLIVDQIIDIVSEVVKARRATDAPGLLGSAVIGGKVTDLLDLHAIVRSAGENWLDGAKNYPRPTQNILLVERSPVARQMVADLFATAGYDVLQAGEVAEALLMLAQRTVDVVLLASSTSAQDRHMLRDGMICEGGVAIPLVDVSDTSSAVEQMPLPGSAARVSRLDRIALLQTVKEVLASATANAESLA